MTKYVFKIGPDRYIGLLVLSANIGLNISKQISVDVYCSVKGSGVGGGNWQRVANLPSKIHQRVSGSEGLPTT